MLTIKKAGRKWWREINRNYKKDFPKEERIPFPLLLFINKRGMGEFLVFTEEDDSLAGYVIVNQGREGKWVLINYLAVVGEKRSKGYGGQMIALLIDYFREKEGILLEIEKPGEGKDEKENEIRRRRKDFYLKNGIKPSTAEIDLRGVLMELMYYGKEVDGRMLLNIHKSIYEDIIGAKRLSKFITY